MHYENTDVDWPPETRLLAHRYGLEPADVMTFVAQGRFHEVFRRDRGVNPEAARATLDGWKLAWQIRDRNDSRQRLADIKAKAAAKLPPKKPRPTPRRPFRPWSED